MVDPNIRSMHDHDHPSYVPEQLHEILERVGQGFAHIGHQLHEIRELLGDVFRRTEGKIDTMSDSTQAALDQLQTDVTALAAQITAFLAGLPKGGLTQPQLDEMANIDSAVKAIAASVPAPAPPTA